MNQNNFCNCIVWDTPLKGVKSLSEQDQEKLPSVCSVDNCNKLQVCNPRAGGKYIILNNEYSKQPIGMEDSRELTTTDKDKRLLECKVRLSGYIAKKNLKGNAPTPDLDELMKANDWPKKLSPIPDQDLRENLLLEGLIHLSPNIGDIISLQNVDVNTRGNPTPFLYALSYCSMDTEFSSLLEELKKSQYVKQTSEYSGQISEFVVTKQGRKKLKEINNKTSNKNSKTAFIAMWMNPFTDDLKKSIERAIKNAGYKPLRIDDEISTDKIDDKILTKIQKSKFVVCDITAEDKNKPRASVFFEAGYAKGKNIPVIWSCNKTMKEMQASVFDTRQYHCIFWDKNRMNEFEKELQKQIEKNEKIGKGTLQGGKE